MTTRPDILYSVNCFGQPTVAAWAGLKRVLQYLKGTHELKLFFRNIVMTKLLFLCMLMLVGSQFLRKVNEI